jgi:rare lipoprotein A
VTTSSSVLVSSEDTSSVRTTAPPPVAPPAPAGGAVNHGRASWYARGASTANGERFEPDGLTYAHLSHAFGTMTRFCHAGRCVVARCNDRGPAAWTGRSVDLSRGAFAAIAPLGAGVVDVTWEAA